MCFLCSSPQDFGFTGANSTYTEEDRSFGRQERACRRGDFVNCQNQPISGTSTDGGYAEMMIAQATGLVAIPDDLLSTEAAPLLCAGLTTFNGLRNSKARPGELVAIQGVGGLGHLGIQFARRMGFQVAAIARGPEKESLARKLGAHHYIDSNAQDPVAALQTLGGARLILATAANSKVSLKASELMIEIGHWKRSS
jgi:alcohol dehydrogenase, propanol-preferring